MPRKAREKHCEAIYHIMCHSISEVLLFCNNEDKDYYLSLLKRYSDGYKCSIYAFCLMDNHLHIHLDPKGCDVSKFMHSINTAYVRYYNKKYTRHGHLFQERFESRVLDSDEYNLTVSAYIHNNAKDIQGFTGKEEYYKYSSYGVYLGICEDHLKLIDKSFIYSLFNIKNRKKFAEKYFIFVSHQRDVGSLKKLSAKLSIAVQNEYISGRKVIIRDLNPSKVIGFIANRLFSEEKSKAAAKLNQNGSELRAFTAYVLRVLCGLGYKEICSNIYNITISGCARLCGRGYELVNKGATIYTGIFDDLISIGNAA